MIKNLPLELLAQEKLLIDMNLLDAQILQIHKFRYMYGHVVMFEIRRWVKKLTENVKSIYEESYKTKILRKLICYF